MKNTVTIWSSTPTPGQLFGENSDLKRYMHPSVYRCTIYDSEDMEAT